MNIINIKYVRILTSSILIAVTSVLYNCQPETVEKLLTIVEDPFDSYDRKNVLENIGKNIILPSYQDFSIVTDSLKTTAISFTSQPSEINLIKLQNVWKETALSWKRAELFRLGPGNDLSLGFYNSIDYNPANTADIESCINTSSAINNEYVNSKAAWVKGLWAVEYLIFTNSGDIATVVNLFKGNSEEQKRRCAYLVAVCENLNIKAKAIEQAWLPSEGNYIEVFIQQDGQYVNNSLALLVAELANLTNVVKIKVSKPFGNLNGNIRTPNATEAPLSKISLMAILHNLRTIEKTFLGNGTKGNLNGIDDLLDHIDTKKNNELLSQKIKFQLDSAFTAFNKIPEPLESAVINSQEEVQNFYTQLDKLHILFKVDVVNRIGFINSSSGGGGFDND